MMQAIKKLYNFVQQNLFCKIVTYFLVFAPIVICMEKGTSVKKGYINCINIFLVGVLILTYYSFLKDRHYYKQPLIYIFSGIIVFNRLYDIEAIGKKWNYSENILMIAGLVIVSAVLFLPEMGIFLCKKWKKKELNQEQLSVADLTEDGNLIHENKNQHTERDHVFHVIRVWLLGIYLLLTDNSYITGGKERLIDVIHFEGDSENKQYSVDKNKLDEKEMNNSWLIKQDEKYYKVRSKGENYFMVSANSFSGDINILEKISMWTLMALCHDLGYPLEKSKKILAKTENMMEAFVSQANINGDLRFDGTRDSNNKDIILFTSKKMKVIEQEGVALYKASVQEKYKFKYMLSLEAFAHGVISSIIIYKKLNYFKETDNNSDANYVFQEEDARQFYMRRDILRAMASHTCQDIYHIDVATFPMLLFVCDELQEWGRKSWKSMYKGVTNNAVQLSIKTFNSCKIEYEEQIDMSNAGEQQLVDNIKRILKYQYMLYQTTFRDGQYTARRQFDYTKHIHIKINEEYKSIKQIDIDFSINHGSEDNTFILSIKNSGDRDKKSEAQSLTKGLSDLLEPFKSNRKYGNCTMNDEREEAK